MMDVRFLVRAAVEDVGVVVGLSVYAAMTTPFPVLCKLPTPALELHRRVWEQTAWDLCRCLFQSWTG